MSADPYDIYNSTDNRSASVVQVESSKHLTAMIVLCSFCAALSAYALATSFHARDSAWMTETRYLQLQDYVEKMRFEMASHGIKPPDLPPELRGK